MEDGTVNTCSGQFIDDGDGGDYSTNSYTYTICPETPGDVIQVDFVAFNIYQSANYQNSDFLLIYDGDDVSVGDPSVYTGTSISGLPVIGTVNNTSGCLTFVFSPGPNSPGGMPGWEGLISCTTPCDPPTGASMILDPEPSMENNVSVCLNQDIIFADDGSFAAPGFTIENYIWNFDDGVIEEGPNLTEITHAFTEPGEYIVTLTVQDDNGCVNTNLIPLQVLVSTVPLFNTNYSEQLCIGGEGFVNGSPVQSQTWTALPPQVVSGETYLADGDGFTYESSLLFDFFDEGQTLESIDDLFGIDVNMEHSYMGDLQIQIECPDGTEVILVEYPNGGGGTYLGEAVDDGTDDPGVGYDYTWEPNAVNGTWGENSGGVNILPSGSYESDYDLSALIGCPLNGEWSLEIIDNLAIDNGYIFEWGINFNPELVPGVTTFTPEIGLGLDSTWITGPHIINSSADGNLTEILPPAVGTYDYTLFASNNFGCTFDTTVTVEVFPEPTLNLPESITGDLCTQFEISPEITSELYSSNISYDLVLENVQQNTFSGSSVEVSVNGSVIGTFDSFADSAAFSISVENGDEITLNYTDSGWGADGNQVSLVDQFGNFIFQSVATPVSGILFESIAYNGLEFSWTPEEGLDNPNELFATGEFVQNQVYELSVFPTGFPVCTVTDQVQIITGTAPDPGISTSIEVCENGTENFNLLDQLEGNPDSGGVWLDENGNDAGTQFDPLINTGGIYTYSLNVGSCGYESELDISVNSLNLEELSDTTICENGIAILNAQPTSNLYPNMSFVWNGGLFTGNSIEVQPLNNSSVYEVYGIFGDDGCLTNTVSSVVNTLAPLQMDGITDQLICLGDSVVVSAMNPSGGMEPYNYSWTSGILASEEDTIALLPSVTTTYTLELTDACESTAIEEEFTISLNPIISAEFSSPNSTGCYPISPSFIGEAADVSLISSVVWEFGDGGTSNSVNQTSHTYLNPGIYDVSLTINGLDGCVYSHTEEEFVEAYNVPTSEFNALEQTLVIPNTTFEFINYSSDNDINTWTFDAYGSSDEENPEFTFPLEEPSDLEVELITMNNDGCSDTTSYTFYLVNGFALFAPNAFTPDGDGINDAWQIRGVDIDESEFELNIYNRYGEIVFTSNSPDKAWDGSHAGGEYYVQNGVYSYQIITREKTSGNKKELKGFVSILR